MDAWAYGLPRRQSLCDVQFTCLPSPSITAETAGRGTGEEGRLRQSLKGPSRLGPP